MLLVWKKDGLWHFCVDYWALNKVNVLDKYLIPVIQEFLDELHGAHWLNKLYLRAGYHQIRVAPEDIPRWLSVHTPATISFWLCTLA